MTDEKKGFIFYRSFMEALEEVDDSTFRKVVTAISSYALDGEEIDISGIGKALFALMKPIVDTNNKRYENGKKGGEYGNLGGRPKNESSENPKETLKKPQENPKETPNKPQANPKKTPEEEVEEEVEVEEEKEKKQKEKKSPDCAGMILEYSKNPKLRDALTEFVVMRKEIKKPMSDHAMKLLFQKLDRLGRNDEEKIEILNNSILGKWQGIFELKRSRASPMPEWYTADPKRKEESSIVSDEEAQRAMEKLRMMGKHGKFA